MGMRIKRDVTIAWEMSEDIAICLLEILEDHDCKGILKHENAAAQSLDSLYAALPGASVNEPKQRNKSDVE